MIRDKELTMYDYLSEIKIFLEENSIPYKEEKYGVSLGVNGIKLEYNCSRNHIIVGFSSSDNDKQDIYYFLSGYFDNDKNNIIELKTGWITIYENASLQNFIDVFKALEEFPSNLEKEYRVTRGSVSFNPNGIFYKMVNVIKYFIDNEMGQPDRNVCKMDAIDELITIGESINRTPENSYREHIVPCDFIIREAVEMYNDGKSLTEIASMMQTHLKIVLITNEEADFIDNTLKLKTVMPTEWKIGDSVFARLEVANIKMK